MKFTLDQIVEMRSEKDLAASCYKENKEQGLNTLLSVRGVIAYFRASYYQANNDMSVILAEAQRDEKLGKEIPEDEYDVKSSVQEIRFNRAKYIASLAGIYSSLKETKEGRGRFFFLFHPFQAYKEYQAMNALKEELSDLDVGEEEFEGYRDLTSGEELPSEAVISKDGLEIKIEDTVEKSPVDLSFELKEDVQEIEPFAMNEPASGELVANA